MMPCQLSQVLGALYALVLLAGENKTPPDILWTTLTFHSGGRQEKRRWWLLVWNARQMAAVHARRLEVWECSWTAESLTSFARVWEELCSFQVVVKLGPAHYQTKPANNDRRKTHPKSPLAYSPSAPPYGPPTPNLSSLVPIPSFHSGDYSFRMTRLSQTLTVTLFPGG